MTNENTAFDLEWAKRGGVFLAQDNQLPQHFAFFGMTCGIVVKRLVNSQSAYSAGDWFEFAKNYTPIRMATRAECAAAGIEYIERHVELSATLERIVELERENARFELLLNADGYRKHFEELAELRKDSERLNAMISMVGENQIVGIEKQDEEWLLSKYDDADEAPTFVWKCYGDTPREAIDASTKVCEYN